MSVSRELSSVLVDGVPFNEWLSQLKSDMARQVSVFEQANGMHQRRQIARSMVALMTFSLKTLGVQEGNDLRGPIHELMFMLSDLNNGRQHPWGHPSERRRGTGSNIEPTSRKQVRLWSVAMVRMLLEGETNKTAAYKNVARVLTEAGLSRRNTDPNKPDDHTFSHKTVQRWWLEYRRDPGSDEERVEMHAARCWASVACAHSPSVILCQGNQGRPCVSLRQIGLKLLESDPVLPLLMNRLDSATSG